MLIENLEDRRLFAVTVAVTGGVLTITGDDGANLVDVRQTSGTDTAREAMRMGRRQGGFGGAAGALGGAMPQKPKRPQMIYILDANNKPRGVEVRTGISDGRYTQIVEGNIKEGDPVIIGTATSKIEGPAAFGGAGQGGPGGRPSGGGRGSR